MTIEADDQTGLAEEQPTRNGRLHNLWQRVIHSQEIAVLLGLLAVGIFFSIASPYFLTVFNLFQIARQMVVLAVIAVGMTFVISSGEIDISVGSMYNLAATVMALLIARNSLDPWLAVLFALLVGILAGALNGTISVLLGLPTLIVTLGTISLYRGLTILLSGGLSIGNLPDSSFFDLGSQRLGPIPYLAIITLAIVAFFAWVFRNIVFAEELLAMGSNVQAAQRVGIGVKRRKIQVMALNGLLCGVAAVLGMSYLRAASPQSGVAFELSAIAATVVGGTPLQGGVGTVWGSFIGIALIMIIQNGLVLLGLPAAWQIASTGVLLLGAVAVQQLVRRRASG